MQAPSASELLEVWERARAQPVATQALMLLAAASPGRAPACVARSALRSPAHRNHCLPAVRTAARTWNSRFRTACSRTTHDRAARWPGNVIGETRTLRRYVQASE